VRFVCRVRCTLSFACDIEDLRCCHIPSLHERRFATSRYPRVEETPLRMSAVKCACWACAPMDAAPCSKSASFVEGLLVVKRMRVTPLNAKSCCSTETSKHYSIALLILRATDPDFEICETRLIDSEIENR
jgi:hypothetical protein